MGDAVPADGAARSPNPTVKPSFEEMMSRRSVMAAGSVMAGPVAL